MARDISSKIGIGNGGVAATSYTMPMPPEYAAGDVLVHIASVSYTAEPTSATGGSVTWNKYVFSNDPYNAVCVFWCVAGSSADTPPTVNLVTSRAWNYTTIALRGVNTTTPFQGYARADATAGYTLQTPAIASVTADTLAIHVGLTYGPTGLAAPLHSKLRYLGAYKSSSAIIAATATQSASGALERDYWYIDKTTSTNIAAFVLAINNAATVETGAILTNIPAAPAYSGNFTAAAAQTLFGDTVTVRAPNYFAGITAIKSVAMHTATSPAYAFAAAEWQYGMGFANATNMGGVGAWTGGWWELPATLSMTGKVLPLSFNPQQSYYGAYIGQYGSIVVFKDSAHAWEAFTIADFGNDVRVATPPRTYDMVYCPDTMTPLDSGGGTLDWDDITHIGKFMHRVGSSTQTVVDFVNAILPHSSASPLTVTGRNVTGLTVKDIYKRIWSNKQGHSLSYLQANVQMMFTIPLQIGNGSAITKIAFTGQSFAFAPYEARWYPIADDVLGLTLYPSASDDYDLRSATFVTTTKQSFTWHASSSTSFTHQTAGMSFIGPWRIVWKTGIKFELVAMTGVYSVDGKAQKLDACTFSECSQAGVAYLRLDGGADVDNKSGAVSSRFTKGTEDYAVELRTAGFYDFTDTTFSGYTNELYISGPAGTYTITLAVGQTQPDVYNPNSRTIVWDVPTVDVTFGPLEAGSQVVVFEQGTTTEMFRDDNSATSEVWTAATGAYDYTIMKAGLLPIRGSGASPTASITIAPQQKIDWAYVASSVLVFADLAFDFGSKYLKCNIATTPQNLYAFLIESWIAQSSLRNKDFIMTPNGPNGFALIDGWETRGFTTAGTGIANTTLSNLSRDGLRYLNGTTETAVWAAILTSGVPAGKQVRYQQSDNGATISAVNTGNMDQLVQTYGDATHGNFDKRGYLVLKVQAEGYDQAEVDAYALYGSLGAQLYSIGLTPTANTVATGNPAVTLTLERGTYNDVTSGKTFSIKIVSADSGEDIMRELRYNFETGGEYPAASGYDGFDWHDLIQQNGSDFKTVRGNVYGAAATNQGVVVYSSGTTLHPDFTLFTADDGTTYAPPVLSDVSITSMPTAGSEIRLQIKNVTAEGASAWAAGQVYVTGAIVKRTTGLGTESTKGLYFRATTGGTSHATTEPTWDITVGNTTTDNTVTWTCYAILFYDADPAAASLTDTYIDGEEFLDGESAEIRFAEMATDVSFKVYDTTVVVSATGFSALVAEDEIPEYATFAIDGSTQESIFSPNFTSNYVVLDSNTDYSGKGAFAYYCYTLTTSQGMARFWGGITALDAGNLRINVATLNLLFDETNGFVKQTDDVRIFRSDGTRPALDPTTGGHGIEINWRTPVSVVTTGGSALTPTESAQLMALPSATTISASVWAYVVTGSTTAVQMMRGFAAMLLGKVSGAGTGAETFRDIADTKDVATFTVDSSGNRTAVTRNLT